MEPIEIVALVLAIIKGGIELEAYLTKPSISEEDKHKIRDASAQITASIQNHLPIPQPPTE